jgi:hypothetical protein
MKKMKTTKCLVKILFLISLSFIFIHEAQAQKKKKIDLKQEELDIKLSGYKPQVLRGKITELKAYGKTIPLQSVEITPSNGISIMDIKECQPDPGQAGQNKPGVKVWSITISVEDTTQAGERSVVLETPQGKSKPEIILIATHFPIISDLQVKRDGTVVFSVFDEEGDFSNESGQISIDYFTDYGGYGDMGTVFTKDYSIKDQTNIVCGVTLSFKGSCELEIFFTDKNGYESNKLKTKIQL